MKRIILTAIGMSLAVLVNAQDFVDNALLFSRIRPGGSARIQGIGGAQVSLGGDFSSAYSNAAGLGMYNRSEFTITPAFNISGSTSSYFGETSNESKGVFNIPGVSLVFQKSSGREEGFLGGSFAVTLNRINDFNQNYRYSGTNQQNSIVNYFLEDANGVYFDNEVYDPSSLEVGGENFYNLTALAYHNFLIDSAVDDLGLYYDSPLYWDPSQEDGSVRQTEISERKGAMNEWSIAYGANFSDKFFVGARIGISNIRFRQKQIFRESDFTYEFSPDFNEVESFEVEENYNISGNGVNFGVGLIYRPIDFLQVGASILTPTFYQLTDRYEASVSSDWNGFDDESQAFDQPMISEYNITTPMRINTGATLISKIGFISADVEFVNYSKTKYTSDISEGFEPENSDIKAEYQSVVNYRLGGEYRYDKFRFRAGFNYMTNPLINEKAIDKSQLGLSAGFGYREKNFFIDLATTYTQYNGTRVPYFIQGTDPQASQKFNQNNYLLTIGFTF